MRIGSQTSLIFKLSLIINQLKIITFMLLFLFRLSATTVTTRSATSRTLLTTSRNRRKTATRTTSRTATSSTRRWPSTPQSRSAIKSSSGTVTSKVGRLMVMEQINAKLILTKLLNRHVHCTSIISYSYSVRSALRPSLQPTIAPKNRNMKHYSHNPPTCLQA